MKYLLSLSILSAIFAVSSIAFAMPPFPGWQVCNQGTCTSIDLRDWEPPEFSEHAPQGLVWSRFLMDSVRSPLRQLYERLAIDRFTELFIEHGATNGVPGLNLRHTWDERTSHVEWPEGF